MKPLLLGELANVDICSSQGCLGSEKVGSFFGAIVAIQGEIPSQQQSYPNCTKTFPKVRSVSEAILKRSQMDSRTPGSSLRQSSSSSVLSDGDDSALTANRPQHRSEVQEVIQDSLPSSVDDEGTQEMQRGAQHCEDGEDSSHRLKMLPTQPNLASPRSANPSSWQLSLTFPTSTQDRFPADTIAMDQEEQPEDQDSFLDSKMQRVTPQTETASTLSPQTSPNAPKDAAVASTDNASKHQSAEETIPCRALILSHSNDSPEITDAATRDPKVRAVERTLPSTYMDTGSSRDEAYEHVEGSSPISQHTNNLLPDHRIDSSSTKKASTDHSSRLPSQPPNQTSQSLEHTTREVPQSEIKEVPWTMGQHRDFVMVVFSLGLTHCSPSVIMEEMKHLPKDISRENIKSHLQKFRKTTDKSVTEFMEEFDAFLLRVDTEMAGKAKEVTSLSSSSSQNGTVGSDSVNPLDTIAAGSDPEELLGGEAAAYAAYAVGHDYAPRNDRNLIRYEGTPEELPRLSIAEQKSSLGQSLKHVKGALDFVRDLLLKKRHGIPFRIDKRIPPFLNKQDVAEHFPGYSRYASDLSDKPTANNAYSATVPTHTSMSVPGAPTYGPPYHHHHYPAPDGGGYPYVAQYRTGDGVYGSLSGHGYHPANSGDYPYYHEFHHPTMHYPPPPTTMHYPPPPTALHYPPPPPTGYPSMSVPFNPYHMGSYIHPDTAQPSMSDYAPEAMPQSGGMRDVYETSHVPPYQGSQEAYFEPPHNMPSYYHQNESDTKPEPIRSGHPRNVSVGTYSNVSSDRATHPRDARSLEDSRRMKRSWSPITSPSLQETEADRRGAKRLKPELNVDTLAACATDRPLSFELADLGLDPGRESGDRRTDLLALSGADSQSSPFSVTSALRHTSMRPSPAATPDRVTLDFGRSVATPTEEDRYHN